MSKLTEKEVLARLRELDANSEVADVSQLKKDKPNNEVNELCKLFQTKYFQILKTTYVISHIDRITMSKLLKDYGRERLLKAINYFTCNFKEIPNFNGFPSIQVMGSSWKNTIFPLAEGLVNTKQIPGQFSGADEDAY